MGIKISVNNPVTISILYFARATCKRATDFERLELFDATEAARAVAEKARRRKAKSLARGAGYRPTMASTGGRKTRC